MKKKISVDGLSKKIIYACTKYALEVKQTDRVHKVIADIICQTEKTAQNRTRNNDWSFEEVQLIAQRTGDEDLKTFVKQQF